MGVLHSYLAVTTPMLWNDANDYCLNNYGTGLATIEQLEIYEAAAVRDAAGILTNVWIGLHDQEREGDWVWQDGTLCLSAADGDCANDINWAEGQPNDFGGSQDCGYLDLNNEYGDASCNIAFPFLCEAKYKLIMETKTWSEANAYCYDTYLTQLATIITDEDYNLAVAVKAAGGASTSRAWIGLNDVRGEGSWYWSDGHSCDYASGNCANDTHWYPGQPNNYGGEQDCADLWSSNGFTDMSCDNTFKFLCNVGYNHHQRIYQVVSTPSTWSDANAWCQSAYGTSLATITTPEQFEAATHIIESSNIKTAWIGLNDLSSEGTWQWADGHPCYYAPSNLCANDEHWSSGEPNNFGTGGEHCGEISYLTGLYNDNQCTISQPFLCNFAKDCSERRRRSWSDLNKDERDVYIDGFIAAENDRIVLTNIHAHEGLGGAYDTNEFEFLPYHRGFIYEMESAIRRLGGKYSCFAMPYWDWTEPGALDLILHSGLGGSSSGQCLDDGSKFDKDFYQPLRGHDGCLIRNPSESCSFTSYASLMDNIDNNPQFCQYHGALTGFPLITPHICVGGAKVPGWSIPHMYDFYYSPDDPIFYLHYTFIDYQFALWQDCHNYDGSNQIYSCLNLDADLPYFQFSRKVSDVLDLSPWKVMYEKGPFWSAAHVDDENNCGISSNPINENWFYDNDASRRRRLKLEADDDDDDDDDYIYAQKRYRELSEKMDDHQEMVHAWAKDVCRYDEGKNGGTVCEIPYDFDDCSDMKIPTGHRDIDITLHELLAKRGINKCMKTTVKQFYDWSSKKGDLLALCAGCYAPFCDRDPLKQKCDRLLTNQPQATNINRNVIPMEENKNINNNFMDYTFNVSSVNLILGGMAILLCFCVVSRIMYQCGQRNNKRGKYRIVNVEDEEKQ